MKFNKLNKTIAGLFCAATITFGLTSCQDPIFYTIRQEVKLEKATIGGDIYSIVRYGNDIFISNGKIYHKGKDGQEHGQWQEFSKPDGYILKLAADKDNLYAIALTYKKNDTDGEMKIDTKKLYKYESGNWSSIKDLGTGVNDVAALMCTNSYTDANRKAFINIEGTVYSLPGLSKVTGADGKNSCAYLTTSSKTFFYSGNAACSDFGDTTIYYSNGTSVYKTTDGTNSSTVSSGVKGTVNGVAAMADSIFISTNAGSALVDKNTGTEIDFANLTSTLSTLYECYACLAVDPSKNHTETPIYAGISVKGSGSNSALFSHEGLWSYYPNRGNWNIE